VGADAADPAAADGDGVQVQRGREGVGPAGGEQDVLAVGRPAADVVVGGVEGQPRGPAPLDGDDEDVVVAVPVGGEGDELAVGAEDGVDVVLLVHGDGAGDAAGGVHDPDVAEVAEGDPFAVGRDVGGAGEADGLLGPGPGGDEGGEDG
jgi:hypothetical protein